jgi:cytosine/creatinine deaminase
VEKDAGLPFGAAADSQSWQNRLQRHHAGSWLTKGRAVPGDGSLQIANARVRRCLVDAALPGDGEQTLVDIAIEDGRIAALRPAGEVAPGPGANIVDQDGGEVWPGLVDLHTHLDKGHIWPRAENADGTFAGAMAAAYADQRAKWTIEDVDARFAFGLRCAFAHGTVAIRTHLESQPPHHEICWPVFRALQREWAGRIHLQAVGLIPIEDFSQPRGETFADHVAGHGGVLGAFLYMHPDLDRLLERMLALAAERGLDLDLHVDESGDPGAVALRQLAAAALRHGFNGKILCGHCCSLAVQEPTEAARTLDLVRAAEIAVVSLPMCNLYLQDRGPGRTPRWRGVTLLHEMAARGIKVALASDNCRDPFHAYGDHDMLEVFREAVRIAHLDRPLRAWPQAISRTPAAIMALPDAGVIRVGGPADLLLFRARSDSELLSRPQSDRIVLRAGREIDTTPPDYRELDEALAGRAQ